MSDFYTLNELVYAAETVESESPTPEQERTWLPETPAEHAFGNQADDVEAAPQAEPGGLDAPQVAAAPMVSASYQTQDVAPDWVRHCDPGYHDWPELVNRTQVLAPQDPVDVIRMLLGQPGVNLGPVAAPGRKNVFNDFMKGRLVSLLGMGLSLRQAGAALSVSHVAISKELKRNPDLAEQVNKARHQAQIEPLLAVLRASRHSWRAATWLVNYLDKQAAARDEEQEGSDGDGLRCRLQIAKQEL